jgi:SAM-dependent methyltransferase
MINKFVKIFKWMHPKYNVLLNIKKNGKVLDFGCGNYRELDFLAKFRPDLELYGVDIETPNIKRDKIRFKHILPDQKLPFKDNTFDFVGSFHVFEHLDNPFFYIKELQRVLKPGGKILILTPNSFSVMLPGRLNFYSHPDHKRPHNKSSLGGLFEYARLNKICIKNHRPIPFILWLPFWVYKKFKISLIDIITNNIFKKNILIYGYKK